MRFSAQTLAMFTIESCLLVYCSFVVLQAIDAQTAVSTEEEDEETEVESALEEQETQDENEEGGDDETADDKMESDDASAVVSPPSKAKTAKKTQRKFSVQ